jgi:conjugal transfer mating pair stabilization protein TraN
MRQLTRLAAGLLLTMSCLTVAQTQAPPVDRQAIMNEGRAAGAAANAPIRASISEAPARQQTPGYTSNPPQTQFATGGNQSYLTGAAAERSIYCSTRPRDPQCEAEQFARGEANRSFYTRPNLATDPSVVTAGSVYQQPSSVLGALGGYYSGCTTRTGTTGVTPTDTQSCYNYYLREKDASCTKTLTVRLDWTCPAGDIGPTTVTGNDTPVCTTEVRTPIFGCLPGDSGPAPGAFGYPFCTRPDGTQYAADVTGYNVTSTTRPATRMPIDEWSNDCAAWEARVPLNLLPPDGQNPPPPQGDQDLSGGLPTGSVSKCARISSICTGGSGVRLINGVDVDRPCWGYTNQFDCVSLDNRSDCNQPRFGQCTQNGAPQCVDRDPIEPTFCTTQKIDFTCQTRNTTRPETELDCNGQTFTDREGLKWDTGYSNNKDFAAVATYMEAAREAGRYIDPNTLELFKGFDNRCKKKLYGLVNCCNRGGTNAFAGFTNFAVIFAGSGKKSGSKFTYDGLMQGDNPTGFAVNIGSFFGGGLGFGGNMSLESLLPGPWQAAMLGVNLAQMTSCEKDEKQLAMKRDAELCADIGSYCSRRFLGCMERTQTYCCFNSRLAKAINVQGKQQLGTGMGDARNPNCRGFTPAELQRLDLSTMNFTEFFDEVKLATEKPDVNANPSACYYQGQCSPPPQ